MTRTRRTEVKLTAKEQALIEAAAAISHPTAKGANVARMIREAALEAARETIAPAAMVVTVDEENNAEIWWDAAEADKTTPASFARLQGSQSMIVLSKSDAVEFVVWAMSLPGWNDGPSYAPHPLTIQPVTQ